MLYKMSEWESPSGWHCGCTDKLGSGSGNWYLPARFLNISPADYVKLVVEQYKPDKIHFNKEKCVFLFSWKNQTMMRKFKNAMNAAARQTNFQI